MPPTPYGERNPQHGKNGPHVERKDYSHRKNAPPLRIFYSCASPPPGKTPTFAPTPPASTNHDLHSCTSMCTVRRRRILHEIDIITDCVHNIYKDYSKKLFWNTMLISGIM